jgi:hypothetical protein
VVGVVVAGLPGRVHDRRGDPDGTVVKGPKQAIDVICPRCKGTAGRLFGWIEVEYRSTYDEQKQADVGRVDVEVKIADSPVEKWASATLVVEHTCPAPDSEPTL